MLTELFSPNAGGENCGQSSTCPILNTFNCSGDICQPTLKSQILHVFGSLISFGEACPKFLNLIFKIRPITEHGAKSHANQLIHLEDLASKGRNK